MTVKEMNCILSAIRNAKNAIEELACEDYPLTEFADGFGEMFYQLNDMCRAITKKIAAAEKGGVAEQC